jgi:acyl-CoA synthetase (AMP-forming)/AMP-acid ligase II
MTVLAPDDHSAVRRDPSDSGARDRLRSVGRPIPGVSLDILDVTSDARLADGQVGEVAVTREGLPARARTGDLGYLSDGYLFLVGRASDRIIRGGENIDPVEVENVLDSWPAVAESAVVGQPDSEWGETVTAFIIPRPAQVIDESALREYLRSRLATFKCPDRFVVQSELPRNALGKIQRAVLRADLEDTWQ